MYKKNIKLRCHNKSFLLLKNWIVLITLVILYISCLVVVIYSTCIIDSIEVQLHEKIETNENRMKRFITTRGLGLLKRSLQLNLAIKSFRPEFRTKIDTNSCEILFFYFFSLVRIEDITETTMFGQVVDEFKRRH